MDPTSLLATNSNTNKYNHSDYIKSLAYTNKSTLSTSTSTTFTTSNLSTKIVDEVSTINTNLSVISNQNIIYNRVFPLATKIGLSRFTIFDEVILANIDAVFNVTDSFNGLINPQNLDSFNYGVINNNSFSEYLQYRYPQAIGNILCNKTEYSNAVIYDNINILFEPLTEQSANKYIDNITKILLPKSDLSNGGLNLLIGNIDNIEQLSLMLKIFSRLGLQNSSLVIEIDTVLDGMINTLYIMSQMFQSFYLFKPLSCYGTDIVYAIGKNKLSSLVNDKRASIDFIEYSNNFKQICQKINDNVTEYDWFKVLALWKIPTQQNPPINTNQFTTPLSALPIKLVDLNKANSNVDMLIIIDKIKNGEILFPYKRLYTTDAEIYEMFNNLKQYRYEDRLIVKDYNLKNIKLPKDNRILLVYPDDYDKFNKLSDMFQESNRMKCILYGNNKSPYQSYLDEPEKVIKYAIDNYYKITPHTLRESIFKLFKECTTFRPSNLMTMIQMYKCKNILDFSSGWGDRLLGAMACDKDIEFYCGVDPNSALHPKYQEMINFIARKNDINKDKYMMIQSPFQSAILPNKPFDLVFTSPPYFDLEIYSKESTQSTEQFKSENDWYNGFLIPSVNKAWNALIKGGHFVLVINQRSGQNYVENIMAYMSKLKGDKLQNSKYSGYISYSDINVKNPQPMFIFRKE